MTMEKLSDTVLSYKKEKSVLNKENAVNAMVEYLYLNLSRYRLALHDEDTRSDYITWLYPKISRIVEQFNPEKAGLRTYLNWVVHLTFKSFCRDLYGKEARQQVYLMEEQTRILSEMADRANSGQWQETLSDTGLSYPDTLRARNNKNGTSSKKQELTSRKLLLLACKSGYALDDQLIAKIVHKTGMNEDDLRNQLNFVRQRWMLSLDHVRELREKRYGYYLRAQKSLLEMKNVTSDSTRYAYLEREYAYCIKRVEYLKNQGERLHTAPSNRFLASVLGMCRGTVDATLASVRNHEYFDVS